MDPLTCLALTVYFEAGNQDFAGKLAVAQVVMNRVASGRYPDEVCAVVEQGGPEGNALPDHRKCQFSWRCDGKADIPANPAMFEVSRAAAWLVLHGLRNPKLEGVLHYHADYVFPRWAKSMRVAVQIGDHIFYVQS